jgi:aminopeptidase N
MRDESLSNYEPSALAEFYFRPSQTELTEPYVERYFHELPRMPNSRTDAMAERLAQTLFPRFEVTAETLRLAEECLADRPRRSPVRRPISDYTDDLAQALRSREALGW